MKCPNCKEVVNIQNVAIKEEGEDRIMIELICDGCDYESFAIVDEDDFIINEPF